MFIFRKRGMLFNVFFVATFVFAIQALCLVVLSIIYPPTRFRTSINELLLDGTEYSALVSFIIAFLACDWLSRKLNELTVEFPLIITWGMTKPEKDLQKLQEKWETKTPTWEHPLVLAFIVCALYFVFARRFGAIESQEPVPLTLVLMMNEFVAIAGLVSILYFSYLVSRSILPISKISIGALNIFHIDGMGGMSMIGNLASHRSFFLGLALGFWLVPWLLYCYFTPFLRVRLSPEIANIATPIELLIIAITTVLPLSFFVYDALSIHTYMLKFKSRATDDLARDYANASARHQYIKMRSLRSQIEKIGDLKEWPLGSVNIGSIAVTIALPLVEFVVKQLLIS